MVSNMSVDPNAWNDPRWQNGRTYGFNEGYQRAKAEIPFPPVPTPSTASKEYSRFWIALALLGSTVGIIGLAVGYPTLPFWQFIIGAFIATTGSAVNYYFGNRATTARQGANA